MEDKMSQDKKLGKFFMAIFVLLILGGIITKRVFNHPEFMMMWHLPAAVFLVLGGRKLTRANRLRYYRNKSSLELNTKV